MALRWQRWLKYAKAKLDATVREGEREMDRLEAEQAARAEGKPWLSSTGEAPTLDEVRERIRHGSRVAGSTDADADADADGPTRSNDGSSSAPAAPEAAGELGTSRPRSPAEEDAEEVTAAFDLAARQRAAAERLTAIRDELGLGEVPPGEAVEDDDDTGEDIPPPPS